MNDNDRQIRLSAVEAEVRKVNRKIRKNFEESKTLTQQVQNLERERKALLYPAAPAGDAICFRKRFATSSTVYTYLAQRAGGLWFATGITGPNGVSWEQLVDFIRRDNTLPFAVEPMWSSGTLTSGGNMSYNYSVGR